MLNKINRETFGDVGSTNSFFLLFDSINQDSAQAAVQWIIQSNMGEEPPSILNLLICSEGGDLQAAFAIIDVMRGSQIPVRTIGLGGIASAGLMIFMAGTKGERILTPNTSVMSHRFSAGSGGKSHELIAVTKEFQMVEQRMLDHYKKCTGLKEKRIRAELLPPEDVFLSAQEALELGICDKIKSLD